MGSFFVTLVLGLALIALSAYGTYRWGCAAGIMLILGVGFALYMSGPAFDAGNLLVPLIMGMTGGAAYRKESSLQWYVVLTSILLASSFAGNYFYLKKAHKIDVLDQSKVEMTRIMETSNFPEDKKKEIEKEFDNWLVLARDVLPFLYFAYSLFFTFIGYQVLKRFRIRGGKDSTIKGLEYFRLNDYFIFALLGSWALVLFIKRANNEVLFLGGLNFALILSILYFIQALGVIKYFLKKKRVPGYLMPLTLIFIFFIAPPAAVFLMIVLSGVGILDLWADFRKLNQDTMI